MSKGQFVGVVSSIPTMQNVSVTPDNMDQYFDVTNSEYYFKWNGSSFITNGKWGGCYHTTKLTAKKTMPVSFTYYWSCRSTDLFYLTIGDTTIESGRSGETTVKNYSGIVEEGSTITFRFDKKSDKHLYDDQCGFWGVVVTVPVGSTTGSVARKVIRQFEGISAIARKVTKGFVGINGIAREFIDSGDGFLQYPPVTYKSDPTSACATTYKKQERNLVLECAGALSANASAYVRANYVNRWGPVWLPAGTVIRFNMEVSHSWYADGGLMIVYRDGTTDARYYNTSYSSNTSSFTLPKPGRIYFEASRHSETANGTSADMKCTVKLLKLFIDDVQKWPVPLQ